MVEVYYPFRGNPVGSLGSIAGIWRGAGSLAATVVSLERIVVVLHLFTESIRSSRPIGLSLLLRSKA